MPLNLACFGILGGHGRVHVGEGCLVVVGALEAILRYAQVTETLTAVGN